MPANFRETELYRACVESGIIPRDEESLGSIWTQQEAIEEEAFPGEKFEKSFALDLTLKVEGMWCPTCSWLIEEVLRKTKGLLDPRVSFLTDSIQVKYLPHILTPRDILAKISRLGYRPSILQDTLGSSSEKRDLLKRLGISSILTGNVMMISFALYFGFFQELSQRAIGYLSYPLWVMTTPVIFYGGWPILRRAYAALGHGSTTMETLISVGALAAYIYSIVQMARGSLHLYFDTASMLITLVLLGRYIETHAREKVSAGITDLYKLANQKVRLFTPTQTLPHQGRGGSVGGGLPCGVSSATPQGEGEGGKERWISSNNVKPGDEFLVFADERVPLDGQVISGQGNIDESILTGEAKPVRKGPGDEVMAGVLLLNGELRLKTTRVGKESSLGQMISLMQEALGKKNPAELLADRITHWFVPAILLIAAATAFYLWNHRYSADEALLRSLTVLVIACPCALGIATPIVKVAAMDLGRSGGILIRDPEAFERAKDLNTLAFDKTGTLTEGNFQMQEVITTAIPEQEALSRLASVEIHSDHFLAREIVHRAYESSSKIVQAENFEAYEGMGVSGLIDGQKVFIGNRELMNHWEMNLSSSLEQRAQSFEARGMTIVFFGWGAEVLGFLVFGDSLKQGIPEMVQALQARGIETWLVSGDSQETTRAVCGESGIANFRGQAFPRDKVELIRVLQQRGQRVGMVGDGINDAAALAQADVGFALATGADIAREASDFTLLAGDPTRVLEALDLSAMATKTIRQNLFFAFFYNGLAIPLAVAGFLTPLIAVFAMFASSLTVIGNALRLSKTQKSDP